MASTLEIDLNETNLEHVAFLFTKITHTFISHTNKDYDGVKLKASDLIKFKEENWNEFYQKYFQFFKIICTEIQEDGFVEVKTEKGAMTNELLSLFKKKILLESVGAVGTEITKEGEMLIGKELQALGVENPEIIPFINDTSLHPDQDSDHEDYETCRNDSEFEEGNQLSDLFFNVLDSLKNTNTVTEKTNIPSDDECFETIGKKAFQSCLKADEFQHNIRKTLAAEPMESEPEDVSELEDIEDSEFQKQLNDQEKRNKEKLEETRKQRDQKKKEHEKELQDIRRQQKQCFATLLHCMNLKRRFEEKEQEVTDWIDKCYRKPVLSLLRSWSYFEIAAREWKQFKKLPKDSIPEARLEIWNFHGRVYVLIDTLQNSFDQLEQLYQKSLDALFLKVLQKQMCAHAAILLSILDHLEEDEMSYEWYKKLEECLTLLNPADIPSTTALRRICGAACPDDYEDLKFPEREIKREMMIEEELDQSEAEYQSIDDLSEVENIIPRNVQPEEETESESQDPSEVYKRQPIETNSDNTYIHVPENEYRCIPPKPKHFQQKLYH